jgi:RimJ/RimL family protein N-acetyltransferase
MQRLGFRREAQMIESLRFKGQWVDDLVFAMLAKEWTGNQQ